MVSDTRAMGCFVDVEWYDLSETHSIRVNRIANGNTHLHLALLYDRKDVVRNLVLRKELDCNLQNGKGSTFLHLLAMSPRLFDDEFGTELLESLLSLTDIDVNLVDINENTPLHLAIENGNTNMAKKLVSKKGIQLNGQNNRRYTP